jgi:hypothetical protein
MCKNLKLIALAIDENFFSIFYSLLTSALWNSEFSPFSYVKFYHRTTSRVSEIMPCKMKKNPTIKYKMVCAKVSLYNSG